MKTRLNFSIIPLLLLLFSCESSNSYSSENEIQEKKALSGVTRLQLDGVFNLTLTQSDEESIEVEGPSSLIDKLIIDQEGDLLLLKMEKIGGFNFNQGDFKIRISLKDLKELNYDGVGNVKTNGLFKVGDLKLGGNGVGNIELELEAKEIDADLDMVGNINLRGNAYRAIFKNNGVGNLDASQLIVENMEVNSSGIGKVEIYCEGDLSLVVDGIGKVSYSGNPRILKKEVSGIGKVEEN
ncbi:MAG: hypothetical protein RLZZ207_1968 [Bacteroidota bacterium]|jgi:hypothetical protein